MWEHLVVCIIFILCAWVLIYVGLDIFHRNREKPKPKWTEMSVLGLFGTTSALLLGQQSSVFGFGVGFRSTPNRTIEQLIKTTFYRSIRPKAHLSLLSSPSAPRPPRDFLDVPSWEFTCMSLDKLLCTCVPLESLFAHVCHWLKLLRPERHSVHFFS